ncbi:MAG: hypothetical protein ACK4JE_02545 [Endomicrobiia bacterium]
MPDKDKNKYLKKVINEAFDNVAKKMQETEMSELDMFKAVARTLVISAIKTLDEIEALAILCDECSKDKELMDKYEILYHNLDYSKRYCEGKVYEDKYEKEMCFYFCFNF